MESNLSNTSSQSESKDDGEPPVKKKIPNPEEDESLSYNIEPATVLLIHGEQNIPVPKSILSKHSTCNSYEEVISEELKNVDENVFQLLLKFLCEESIEEDISLTNFGSFLEISKQMKMSTLQMLCSKWMHKNFSAKLYSRFMNLAKRYDMTEFIEYALVQIAERFEMYSEDQFLMAEIEDEEMCMILSMDCLQISSEFQLMRKAERWLKKVIKKPQHLTSFHERVLSKIRYTLMSQRELTSLMMETFPPSVALLIRNAQIYHNKFILGRPAQTSQQTRIRCMEPSLVLAVRNNVTLVQDVVVCAKHNTTQTSHTYTIYRYKTGYTVWSITTAENRLYVIFIGIKVADAVRIRCFDVCVHQWQDISCPYIPYIPSGIAAVQNKLYLCGGGFHHRPNFMNACNVLNIHTHFWEKGTDLPSCVNYGAAAALDNQLYFSGGQLESEGGTFSDQLLLYSPELESPKWICKKSMRVARRGHTMFSTENQYLLVCGGKAPKLSPTVQHPDLPIERYDRLTNQWTEISGYNFPPPLNTSVGSFTILLHQPKMIYSFNQNQSPTCPEVEVWCTELTAEGDKIKERKLIYTLPKLYQLVPDNISYLFFNFNDRKIKGFKNLLRVSRT